MRHRINAFAGAPSGPTLLDPFAPIQENSVGPEGPPTRARPSRKNVVASRKFALHRSVARHALTFAHRIATAANRPVDEDRIVA
ncbi:DUF6053 domain-containing protein [Lysobacter sp. CA199]|uniref:DUF6053 domain-containing protein n=1 Tax=Lysobacter sp. CA199 TaxID=3455608 RepID=UPI003F8D066C